MLSLTSRDDGWLIRSRFKAKLLRPSDPGDGPSWAFIVLPPEVSSTLPRRGRATVEGNVNGHTFQATLDPDGQLSHWLRLEEDFLAAAVIKAGDTVRFEIAPVLEEPEPAVPPDLERALASSPEARVVWEETTTIARLDWIHWIVSAKQAKTRSKRVKDACEMLAGGKKRVCCFDSSGFYSKAFQAPEAAE